MKKVTVRFTETSGVELSASDKWWQSLTKKQQEEYIKLHPRSKYAKTIVTDPKPIKKKVSEKPLPSDSSEKNLKPYDLGYKHAQEGRRRANPFDPITQPVNYGLYKVGYKDKKDGEALSRKIAKERAEHKSQYEQLVIEWKQERKRFLSTKDAYEKGFEAGKNKESARPPYSQKNDFFNYRMFKIGYADGKKGKNLWKEHDKKNKRSTIDHI